MKDLGAKKKSYKNGNRVRQEFKSYISFLRKLN